jgi:AcrR family transcriptional regulator
MSPRPRTVDDSTILEAAVTVLGRIGPERLTLADVGTEAGLSAATLVQRFGSKRDLLLSVLKFATDGFESRLQTAIVDNDSPIEAIFAAAMNRAGSLDEPEVISNMFAFYLSDMRDPSPDSSHCSTAQSRKVRSLTTPSTQHNSPKRSTRSHSAH